MDIKPNRPVRVGNQIVRSGAGGDEFIQQVLSEMEAPVPDDSIEQLRADLSSLQAYQQAVDATARDGGEQLAKRLTAAEADIAGLRQDLTEAVSLLESLQAEIEEARRASATSTEKVSEVVSSKTTSKSADKAPKAD